MQEIKEYVRCASSDKNPNAPEKIMEWVFVWRKDEKTNGQGYWVLKSLKEVTTKIDLTKIIEFDQLTEIKKNATNSIW